MNFPFTVAVDEPFVATTYAGLEQVLADEGERGEYDEYIEFMIV